MRDWYVEVVPNPLDTDRWRPIDRTLAREILRLPPDVPLLLFGAIGGSRDPRKGFDLLEGVLDLLSGQFHEMELMVFGELAPKQPKTLGFPIHYSGRLHDDASLQLLYSAVDAFVAPSRLEAFGQTASEAHACGTPVVAFDNSGLAEIVAHRETGYLAAAFDVHDLAEGIRWVLTDSDRHRALRQAARQRAVCLFDSKKVALQYAEVYGQAIEERKRGKGDGGIKF
jgi:glycosyltransferase involved in cell wall biosynthesis